MSKKNPNAGNAPINRTIVLAIDFVLIIILLAIDQITKLLTLKYLKDSDSVSLIPGCLELDYLENRGSAFGMLQNQKIFILFIGIIFMGIILFLIFRLPAKRKFIIAHICLSAIVSGGIGNMIDRIRLDYVVDFISFVLIHFPIFNFADICVTVSVFILFFLFLFVYKEQDLEFLSFKQNRYREMK